MKQPVTKPAADVETARTPVGRASLVPLVGRRRKTSEIMGVRRIEGPMDANARHASRTFSSDPGRVRHDAPKHRRVGGGAQSFGLVAASS
jgi:hypothetical protein